MNAKNYFTLPLLAFAVFLSPLQAETIPKGLLAGWSLKLDSGEPAWMRVVEQNGIAIVYMRLHVGPDGPWQVIEVTDGRLKFAMDRKRKKNAPTAPPMVEVELKGGKLEGTIVRTPKKGDVETTHFTGKRFPDMPKTPDLSKVTFGHPISLFNGKDMTGWRPHESDKINGWSVKEGLLVNETTKTDFSATGAYANLRTDTEFEDFWLHIDFLVEAKRNSGVYLRGMYEAQVVDRDSPMQGIQGVGAIFGHIAPSINAGKPGGQWQSYDLTLVDRHVTVVLNGVKVIDNQPVWGPTGGAVYTDPGAPGPIHLQGDHTAVKYRNIYLAPVVK
ncbi:MAG: DUF1080 domain-containing protein [Verrucomicrobiales bacterium]|nr:DUF1080 domain-containing protein [Verrucomicrobiales bacterium]